MTDLDTTNHDEGYDADHAITGSRSRAGTTGHSGGEAESDIASHSAAEPGPEIRTGDEFLTAEETRRIYRHMFRARALEERLIEMSKSGLGFFWVGGPGEEAFSTCLGMQVQKGHGPMFDYLHLHYRNSAVLIPMGLDLIEGVRQMLMRATDVNSMGRNFVSHYARRHANVLPVTSVLEVQYTMAPGTAWVQKRAGGNAVSIVLGGDAGAAEGDFASSLIWSTRPDNEVPVLLVVMNNGWGISTSYRSQYGDRSIIDRGRAFGIEGESVDGNDPVTSWHAVGRAMAYCRSHRRPYMLEARVSRLYGHSSASGATLNQDEPDCLTMFQERLLAAGVLQRTDIEQLNGETQHELDSAVQQVLKEPEPTIDDLYRHTYAPSPVDAIYPEDFTGLPNNSAADPEPLEQRRLANRPR